VRAAAASERRAEVLYGKSERLLSRGGDAGVFLRASDCEAVLHLRELAERDGRAAGRGGGELPHLPARRVVRSG